MRMRNFAAIYYGFALSRLRIKNIFLKNTASINAVLVYT